VFFPDGLRLEQKIGLINYRIDKLSARIVRLDKERQELIEQKKLLENLGG